MGADSVVWIKSNEKDGDCAIVATLQRPVIVTQGYCLSYIVEHITRKLNLSIWMKQIFSACERETHLLVGGRLHLIWFITKSRVDLCYSLMKHPKHDNWMIFQDTNQLPVGEWHEISQSPSESAFLNHCFDSKRCSARSVCRARKVQPPPVMNRELSRDYEELVNSRKMSTSYAPQLSRGKRAASSVYLLPPWAFTSHPLLCSCWAAGPLNLDCLAVFQTGFLLLGDWGLLVIEGLCISK